MLRLRPQVSKRITGPLTSSPGGSASPVGGVSIQRGFGFATFQFRLTKFGGLGGVGSRLQSGFFQKVAPTLMPVRRALLGFEVLQGRLGVLPPLDDLDHPCGLVSSDVVPD